MIDPTDEKFERVDRLLGRVELAAALAALALLVVLAVMAP